MEVLTEREKIQEKEKGQDVQPVTHSVSTGEKPGVRALYDQRGQLRGREPSRLAGVVHEKGASLIKHVREHQKGDETEDEIGLKLVTSPVSFGPDQGPP